MLTSCSSNDNTVCEQHAGIMSIYMHTFVTGSAITLHIILTPLNSHNSLAVSCNVVEIRGAPILISVSVSVPISVISASVKIYQANRY